MLKKIRQILKTQEGFTLVELMIVVVILGILAGIGIQQYGRVQERAREGVNDANLKMIANAVRLYQTMEGKDPANLEALDEYGIESSQLKSPWGDDEKKYVIEKSDDKDLLEIYLEGHKQYRGDDENETSGVISIKRIDPPTGG